MDLSVLEPLQRRRPTKLVLALAGVGALAVAPVLQDVVGEDAVP